MSETRFNLLRMAESVFGVVYDGPALEDGSMRVADLAPALLALGELFVDASQLAYPDREPVALNIKANEKGSFIVHLAVQSPDTWEQIVHLFSGPTITALANLKGFIVGGTATEGLFWLIKKMRGRKVASQEIQSGVIKLTLDDGTTIEIPHEVWSLYNNIEVRRATRKVVEPLTREGVDTLEFRSESNIAISLSSEDVAAYDVPEPEAKPLGSNEVEMTVAITSASFIEDNKWRLSDGDASFAAAIEDEDFLRRVDAGEAFRKGDMLRVHMSIEQTRRGDKLSTERRILEVLEHIPRPEQLRLDDPG